MSVLGFVGLALVASGGVLFVAARRPVAAVRSRRVLPLELVDDALVGAHPASKAASFRLHQLGYRSIGTALDDGGLGRSLVYELFQTPCGRVLVAAVWGELSGEPVAGLQAFSSLAEGDGLMTVSDARLAESCVEIDVEVLPAGDLDRLLDAHCERLDGRPAAGTLAELNRLRRSAN